jgi:transcriptional regulator with XRE-family HTH domain
MTIGDRIREARLSQQRSLTEVASKAKISAATLSRIENSKQGVDLGMFMTIAEILKVLPRDLLDDAEGEEETGHDPLVQRISNLASRERAELWRALAENVRGRKAKRSQTSNLGVQVDELLAQADFLREELQAVRSRIRRSK